jgi:hypothetical protein
MTCVLFSTFALALAVSCVAGNSSCPAEPSEEHLALVQRQASFLGEKVAPTSSYWNIQYSITGFRTDGCGDDAGSYAEYTFYGRINGCSTGCQRKDYQDYYGFTTGTSTSCSGSTTSSSSSLQIGITAFESDSNSECSYSYGDDCYADSTTTVSLPNTNGATKNAELCSGKHCVRYSYSTTYVTPSPTPYPTSYPTPYPTKYPTSYPTPYPTDYPTSSPTDYPTSSPTDYPTSSPTDYPTSSPTDYPTSSPTDNPTASPTDSPTSSPTDNPTSSPTDSPTSSPTDNPTSSPTDSPTSSPTNSPTSSPTETVYGTWDVTRTHAEWNHLTKNDKICGKHTDALSIGSVFSNWCQTNHQSTGQAIVNQDGDELSFAWFCSNQGATTFVGTPTFEPEEGDGPCAHQHQVGDQGK